MADLISDFLGKQVGITFEPEDESCMIDLGLIVICAIGTQANLHKAIAKQFESKRSEYYRSYKESAWYNNNLINTYPTQLNLMLKMVSGIYAQNESSKNFADIEKLIQKGFKFTWNYTKQHKVIYDRDYRTALHRKLFKNNNANEVDLLNHFAVLRFLCSVKNIKLIARDEDDELIRLLFANFISVVCYQEAYFNEDEFRDHQEKMATFYHTHQIEPKAQTLYEFIQSRRVLENAIATAEYPFLDHELILKKSVKLAWSRAFISLSRWLDTIGVHHRELCKKTVFSKKEIDRFVLNALHHQTHFFIKDSEIPFFMAASMLFYALTSEFKETKIKYFEEINESMEEIETKLLAELEQVKRSADIDLKASANERSRLIHQIEALKEENASLKRKNVSLNNTVVASNINARELHQLREFVYNRESNVLYEPALDELSVAQQAELLNTKKCSVLGGRPSWVKRLSHLLPNFSFVLTDQVNIDVSFLDNQDAVFINTSYMSHAFYHKIMARLNQSNVPFFYLSTAHNADRTINAMFEQLEL